MHVQLVYHGLSETAFFTLGQMCVDGHCSVGDTSLCAQCIEFGQIL